MIEAGVDVLNPIQWRIKAVECGYILASCHNIQSIGSPENIVAMHV